MGVCETISADGRAFSLAITCDGPRRRTRSFVLAPLRALHLDPGCAPTRADSQGEGEKGNGQGALDKARPHGRVNEWRGSAIISATTRSDARSPAPELCVSVHRSVLKVREERGLPAERVPVD